MGQPCPTNLFYLRTPFGWAHKHMFQVFLTGLRLRQINRKHFVSKSHGCDDVYVAIFSALNRHSPRLKAAIVPRLPSGGAVVDGYLYSWVMDGACFNPSSWFSYPICPLGGEIVVGPSICHIPILDAAPVGLFKLNPNPFAIPCCGAKSWHVPLRLV